MKAWAAASMASKTGEPLSSARCSRTPKGTRLSACTCGSTLLGAWPLERTGQTLGYLQGRRGLAASTASAGCCAPKHPRAGGLSWTPGSSPLSPGTCPCVSTAVVQRETEAGSATGDPANPALPSATVLPGKGSVTSAFSIRNGRALLHHHLILLAGGAGQAGVHKVGFAGEGALRTLLTDRVLRVLAGEHEPEAHLADPALLAAPARLVLVVAVGAAAHGVVRLHAGCGHALQPHALRAGLARLCGAHRVRVGDTWQGTEDEVSRVPAWWPHPRGHFAPWRCLRPINKQCRAGELGLCSSCWRGSSPFSPFSPLLWVRGRGVPPPQPPNTIEHPPAHRLRFPLTATPFLQQFHSSAGIQPLSSCSPGRAGCCPQGARPSAQCPCPQVSIGSPSPFSTSGWSPWASYSRRCSPASQTLPPPHPAQGDPRDVTSLWPPPRPRVPDAGREANRRLQHSLLTLL